MSKILQFPTQRIQGHVGWLERVLAALAYGALLLAVAQGLFSGDLMPFLVAGLVYYALLHHRRIKLAQSVFLRYHVLQAIMLTSLLKVLLVLLRSVLALGVSTLALFQVNLQPQPLYTGLGTVALVGMAAFFLYAVALCLAGKQFPIRWISDWVQRTI